MGTMGGRRVIGLAAAVSVLDLGVPVPGVPVLAPLQSLGRRVVRVLWLAAAASWRPSMGSYGVLAWSPSMSPSIPSMSEHKSWEVLVELL